MADYEERRPLQGRRSTSFGFASEQHQPTRPTVVVTTTTSEPVCPMACAPSCSFRCPIVAPFVPVSAGAQ